MPNLAGPVPNRPLALGEILDGAVSLIRQYPGPLLGLAAIVMTLQLALTVPVQYLSQDFTFSIFDPSPRAGGSELDPLLAVLGVALSTAIIGVISGACAGVVSGMTASVVGRATAGQPISIAAVWADVRTRLWALIGLSLMVGLATGLGSLFFVIGSWVIGAAFAVAVPVMVLERLGPFRAMRRGWELTFTSFGAFMRLFLIRTLATVVIAGVWQLLVSLPFLLAGQVITTINAPQTPTAGQLLLSVFVTALGTMAAGVVVTPFIGCVDALLYVDRRMRAEGYDIELGQRLRRAAASPRRSGVMRALIAFHLEPVPRDPAREEAARELSKDIYRRNEPSFIEQILDWLQRQLGDLLDRTAGSTPGGAIGLLIIVGVVLALIIAVLIRFGPLARSQRSAQVDHLEPTASEDEHRRLAEQFAAEGKYAEAVRERLRAIVRSLTDRGVLDNRLGRTAHEVAVEAGRELPSVSAELLEAADVFGAIWYGPLRATAAHDGLLREVDEKVAAARPGAAGDGPRRSHARLGAAERGRTHAADRAGDQVTALGTTAAPVSPPPAPPAPRQASTWWRRLRLWLVLALAVIASVGLVAVYQSRTETGELDPDAPTPSGARALATLLRERGVTVEQYGDITKAMDAAEDGDTTILVPFPGLLGSQTVRDLPDLPSSVRVVLVQPDEFTLDDLELDVSETLRGRARPNDPGCDFAEAASAGSAEVGRTTYRGPRSVHPLLRRRAPRGRGRRRGDRAARLPRPAHQRAARQRRQRRPSASACSARTTG